VDGVAGGEGDVVEVVQDGQLEFLAGGRRDRYAAHRRGAGAGDVDVDRRRHEGRRPLGALLFTLLLTAESRHRFPHSDASGSGG
jgi:hypothetical protein